ncbi:hypothetical protein ODJ79_16060 [Actinoplanes sp. KI2]|uniref:hypothetical protein n=1 Tax=Actinoplanes sp. KI2 TaxID=2983315 RepID=UPI0021D61079|nr:hypothetical protein [Actinoplanes sp. KI2]MCU7725244.1 hypothetical protein [Actinoplanes sp. KI2]
MEPLEIASALAASGSGTDVAKEIIEKLLDPGLNSALSPAAGLQVSPVVFQSTEQEGRWKPTELVGADRALEVKPKKANGAAAKPPDERVLAKPFGPLRQHETTLFTIKMPGIASEDEIEAAVLELLFSIAGQNRDVTDLSHLIKPDVCTLRVSATWWSDGLEIFAGYAGLSSATAFGSVFNSNANISLQAIPFGNYYPASVLLTWSGWVNPMGPGYWEFQGAVVLDAEGQTSGSGSEKALVDNPRGPTGVKHTSLGARLPAYMRCWDRSGGERKDLRWHPMRGFSMAYEDLGTPSLQPLVDRLVDRLLNSRTP